MDWLSKVFHRPHRPPVAYTESESNMDELREREGLQAELERHGAFIEHHIDAVSARVRSDARHAEDRLRRRW